MTESNHKRKIDCRKLCVEMKSRGLCEHATYFFGKDYLDSCASEHVATPHPMSELEERMKGMGLTLEEQCELLNRATMWGGTAFDTRTDYFSGDSKGLMLIKDDQIEDYVTEVIENLGMESFIEWCVLYGHIDEKWLRESEELAILLDAPIWETAE